jgi:hypothetical protein
MLLSGPMQDSWVARMMIAPLKETAKQEQEQEPEHVQATLVLVLVRVMAWPQQVLSEIVSVLNSLAL